MLRWIIGASLKHRALVIAVSLLILTVSFNEVELNKIDTMPEFMPPYVEIQTEALGLSAAEVEELITVPMEAKLLSGVAWVDEIRSESIPGLSSIVLIFEPETDILLARQMVQERLTRAGALPRVSKPPTMLQPVSTSNRVVKVGLSSDVISHIDMSVLARWTIRPALMGIAGVANVSIWGQRKRQLQVHVDPQELKEKNVSLHQVLKTAGNALWVSPLSFLEASTPGTGGWIDTPNQRLGIRHVLPIIEPDQLASVTVEGTNMSLGDVAEVVENHQPLIGDAIVNDEPGLLLVIEKFPWANTLEVTENVEEILAKLQAGLTGIEIDSSIFRPATYIETSVGNLEIVLLAGSAIMILLLSALQYHWRIALLNIVVITLSLSAALLVCYLEGIVISIMGLVGFIVALGIVIDDVVRDVDGITRDIRNNNQKSNQDAIVATIIKSIIRSRSGLTYASLVMVLSVLPIFFLEDGIASAFLNPLVVSYLHVVAVSMVVALIATPVLSLLLINNASLNNRESPLIQRIQNKYAELLSETVNRPGVSYIIIVCVTVCGLMMWINSEQSLVPRLKENSVQIKLSSMPGTSHPEMNRILTLIGRELREINGVHSLGGLSGRAVMSDKVEEINEAELWINIDSSANYDEAMTAVRQVVAGYPGLSSEISTYTTSKIKTILQVSKDDITVRIYGHENDVLRAKADDLLAGLSKIEGIVDMDVKHQSEEAVIEIEVDLAEAERHKIKPGDVRRASAVLLSGIKVGSLFEEQKVFDVMVWGKPEIRSDLNTIRQLIIDKPDGGHVRLEDVADVRIVPSQTVIKREGISRHLDIGANVIGRDIELVKQDVENLIKKSQFPLKYHAELVKREPGRSSTSSMMGAVIVFVVIGIVLLLQAAFENWRSAMIVFMTLPAAMSGGMITLFVFGSAVTLGSIAGFIMVFGVSVRSSILLIRHYKHLVQKEGGTFGIELIKRGTQEQLVSIITVASMVLGILTPILVMGEMPGLEIMHPMSIVVAGGMVTSLIVNILIIPSLIYQFGIGSTEEFELDYMESKLESVESS